MEPSPNKNLECEEYLKMFQLSEKQFIIGIFQKGFTFYNQQVRALNIFYCLHTLGKINKNTRIGIIGGGIAGFTFAMAALHSKIKVAIIEKGDDLMPLQKGSILRPIHPHIYDWPKLGSESSEAGLPITDWTAADASDVRLQILKEKDIVEKLYSERKIPFKSYLHTYLRFEKISKLKFDQKQNCYRIYGEKKPDENKPPEINCDILIYAIGFGIEKTYHKYDLSYWQCSAIQQVLPVFKNNKYLISGTGDGGLMELLLGRIENFSYKALLKLLNSNEQNAQMLKRLLQDIREDFLAELEICKNGDRKIEDDWIHKRYSQISSRYYQHIVDGLEIKESNSFILHGQSKYEHIFNINKVSLLNGFLIYILSDKITSKFGKGKANNARGTFLIEGYPENHKEYARYSRHGTEKQQLISKIPGLKELIISSDIENKQNITPYKGDIDPLWTNEGLRSIFKEAFYDDIEEISGNSLQTFETFGWLLSESLKKFNKEFRLTIHKVNEQNKLPYYQQIIPYFGTKASQLHGGYGRTF